MPTFDFTAPDGTTHSIEGPEGATREQAFQMLRLKLGGQSAPATPKEDPSVLKDVAMQAPTGFNEGLANTVGAPVDVVNWGLGKVGLGSKTPFLGSQSIKNALGLINANPDNAPAQTTAGQFTRAATNTAASAILPEAALAGAAKVLPAVPRFVSTGPVPGVPGSTMTIVAPQSRLMPTAQAILGDGSNMARTAVSGAAAGLGSEAAGQATEGTALEPTARLIGGMAAGVIPGAVSDKIAVRRALKALPPQMTSDDVIQTAKAGYRSPELDQGIVDPKGINRMATNATNDLVNNRFRPQYSGGDAFRELEALAANNVPTSIADLHASRMYLGELAQQTMDGKATRDAVAATIAKRHLDNYLNNITPADIIAGDPKKAVNILRSADADYGAARRAADVENRMGNAAISNVVTNSGLSAAQKTRQALAVLEKNQGVKSRAYNPDEKAKLNDLVMGDAVDNTARAFSNLAGGGGGIGAGFVAKSAAGLAHMLGLGPVGSALVGAVVPATGSATRSYMSARTLRKANELRDLLLERSPTFSAANASRKAAVNTIKSTAKANRTTDASRAVAATLLSRLNNGG